MKTISVEELAQKLADANRENTGEPWTVQAARVAIEAMSPNPRCVMSDNQKAALLMARVAVFNACIAGMVAENTMRAQHGSTLAYDAEAFEDAINASGCLENAAIDLLGEWD